MRHLILFAFVVTSLSCFGQKTINVSNVTGSYILSNNETLNYGRESALNNANSEFIMQHNCIIAIFFFIIQVTIFAEYY